MRYHRILSVAFLLLLLSGTRAAASVVISELMWSGTDLSSADEWIELANTSSGTLSLSGWTLTKLSSGNEGAMLTLPAETNIGSGGILLIGNYDEEQSRLSITPDIIDTGVSLSNTQLLIRLRNASGTLIDAIDDGVGNPFAGSNSVPKSSMERIDLSGSGQLKSNWQTAATLVNFDDGAALFGTPGAKNGTGPNKDTFAPIEATNFAAEATPLLVSWLPSSSLDLASQELLWNGTGVTLPATATGASLANIGTGIVLTLRSTDDKGNTSSGVTTLSRFFPNIKITEVMANPAGADTEEWIEVGNLGDQTEDISGWVLDEGNSSGNFTIPAGTSLKQNEHIAFPKSVTGLPLDNNGEELSLLRGFTVMDTWTYIETAEEVSYGRNADNTEVFRSFCVHTRNKPNDIVASEPMITIQSGALEGTDKVTLNLIADVLTGSTVHATCAWNYDDGFESDSCNPPSHTFTNPGTYEVTLSFTNFCGETTDNSVTVSVEDSSLQDVASLSPDDGAKPSGGGGGGGGGGERTTCNFSTFDGVRISEFLPNPMGSDTDGEWIELENTWNQPAHLCGWEIDDGEEGSKPYSLDTFFIPAKGFLLLQREKTRIALNNSDEAVRLFGPHHILKNEVSYRKSIEGESFALRSDGLFVWTPFTTPEQTNTFRTAKRRHTSDTVIVSAALPNPEGADAGYEWIELTNVGNKSVDLAGWQIDNRDDSRSPFIIDRMTLEPGGFHRFVSEDTNVSLTNTKDQARLIDPDGSVVSVLQWNNAISARVYRPQNPGEKMEALVLQIIDGDTIDVEIEGKRERVRLIGIDTPETVHPNKPIEKFGKEASEFTRSKLEGMPVTLLFGDEQKDKYDRLLAYVLLPDGTNFNGELIRHGYAYAYLRFPFSMSSLFTSYEAEARRARIGLWADEEVTTYVQQTVDQIEQEILDEIQPIEATIPEEEEPEAEVTEEERHYVLEVIFSEVMSNPPKDNSMHDLGEYIELYNPTSEEVSLEGWILDDDPHGSSKPKTLSEQYRIPALSHFLLCKGERCDAPLGVSLNNSGEELSLTSPDGTVSSVITFPKMQRGEAYAFAGDWCVTNHISPKEENTCIAPIVVTRTAEAPKQHVTALAPTVRITQKRPTDYLRKKYRNIIMEKESIAKEKTLPPLLAALLPQIAKADLPLTPAEAADGKSSNVHDIIFGLLFVFTLMATAYSRKHRL